MPYPKSTQMPVSMTRRDAVWLVAGSSLLAACNSSDTTPTADHRSGATPMKHAPIVLATWNHGKPATERALAELAAGRSALDAAERGVMVVESDCPDRSVGLQGWPDRDGIVTLDAAIMDDAGRSGAVACVRGVAHPIALARRVMDRTPHALLVGPGAEDFARSEGLHTGPRPLDPEQERAWREWLRERQYSPRANSENHDTIGMVVRDADGHMAASCTTSGLAWKMHGRVGDSPLVGAGLFVDAKAGAAVCTGLGEVVMRKLTSCIAVERMRSGASPSEACRDALLRLLESGPLEANVQVGLIVLARDGTHAAGALQPGFTYTVGEPGRVTLHEAAAVS
jgi:N4-(beta-N-acetylglucosaminyl)-L-asparaginase